MDIAVEVQGMLNRFGGIMLIFLPVLFGAIEFIKAKSGLEGRKVEWLSVGLFVLFGGLVVFSFYFPSLGIQIIAIVLFLLMCALAPSGFYKFVNARLPVKDGK